MKIIMFGQKAVPSRLGGVEVVVSNLAIRMVKRGHKVILYNRRSKNIKPIKKYKGVNMHTVFTINKRGLAAISASFFAALKASFSDADIIHIHAEGPAFFTFIPKLFKKKVVVTIHGLDWKRAKWRNGLGSKFIKAGEKIASKYADAIIVLNKNNQLYFKKKYNRKTYLIPNGVNKPKILKPNLINTNWNLKKNSYILFLGRLVPEKGIKNLILAFKKINTNKKLVIAGGTSDTDDFFDEIKKIAQNDSRIIFTGAVQGQVLGELFSNAYLYVLPSELEGMPLSLLEAMSYGNAVLISNIPECTEVIDNHGIVFKCGDISDLKKKLIFALDNPNVIYNLKNTSAKYILNRYNWNQIVDKTLDIYRNCLAND